MTKKLIKHGNSWALVIDRPILDLLQIDPDTPLELSTNGDVLVISPQRDEKRIKTFQSALEKINRGNRLPPIGNICKDNVSMPCVIYDFMLLYFIWKKYKYHWNIKKLLFASHRNQEKWCKG